MSNVTDLSNNQKIVADMKAVVSDAEDIFRETASVAGDKMLDVLDGVTDRRAEFVTVALVVWPDGEELLVRGVCAGHIAEAERDGRGRVEVERGRLLPERCVGADVNRVAATQNELVVAGPGVVRGDAAADREPQVAGRRWAGSDADVA